MQYNKQRGIRSSVSQAPPRGHATAVLTTEAGTRAEHFYRTDGWTEVGRKEDGQIIFQKSLLT
jgi:hypothetical protein